MEIITELRNKGINISLVGDRLKVEPKEKLNPGLIEKIKAHRQDIARELRQAQVTKTYCSWLRTKVSQCEYPCYQWRSKTRSTVCSHFRQYMVNIGRWST